MNETEQTAQERLEQKSLANVRALLDKIERERRGVGLGAALVITGLVFAIGFAWFYLTREERYRDPAKPTAQMSDPEYVSYALNRIQGLANAPRNRARLERLSNAVELAITIDARGIAAFTVEKSSRSSMTDNDLAAFVKFAEPFGSPPAAANARPFVIHARISAQNVDGKSRLLAERIPR